MEASKVGVNPLRPYYIPPTIGEQTRSHIPTSTSTGTTSKTSPPGSRYTAKARDIISDLDYKDHLDDLTPSNLQSVKQFVDDLLWKYTSVLMAQPFEVAKTILQVRLQDDIGSLDVPVTPKPIITSPRQASFADGLASPILASDSSSSWYASQRTIDSQFTGSHHHHNHHHQGYPDSDSDPDEASYFTSSAPYTPTPSTRPRRRRGSSPPLQSPSKSFSSRGGAVAASANIPSHQIVLRRPDSILDVISQLWSKEGAWGVWKGTNATFLYTLLQSLLENWGRSLLSALLNVPDLGLKDDVDRLVDVASPYPWASLCVAAVAAVATGLILAPLDLIRTRLIVTSTNRGSRRTLASLRALPSWFCHSSLVAPTILNSLIHPFFTLSTPLVLRSQFLIDRDQSPTTFSIAKFCTSCVSLFVKLPLETVLRRGQVAVLSETAYLQALALEDASADTSSSISKLDAVVQPGPYRGVMGTMYTIVTEEGSRAIAPPAAATKSHRNTTKRGKTKNSASAAEVVYRRGQGLPGLWRGWKVNWWGVVGLWTAGVAAGAGEGEF
ncbi:mitochondrial carrier domain-containing protein [Xylariaceae sp. FL0255]|nr:mitochondrial carrier domain-containing protein [Xylariaceae sp. FL0255]